MRGRDGFALALLLLCPLPVWAQRPLKDRVSDLFTFGSCGQPLCLDGSISAANGHGDHYLSAVGQGNSAVITFITDAIGTSASNLPLAATTSGVTFRFVGGVPVKSSASSGPIFGERAQTLGRGRFLMGANVTGIRFKSLRGVPIDNLTLSMTHEDIPGTPGLGNPAFENDIIQLRMSLYVDLLVSSFFATYGLFDRVDIGVAVPLVYTSLKGRSTAQVVPFGPPALHFFGGDPTNPVLSAATAAFGSATGIGDVAGRMKINFVNSDNLSFAVLTDARFPTGDEDNLLGAGVFSLRALGVFSSRFGAFSPHLNVGYLWREGETQNDAVLAIAGFDQALTDWATIAGGVLSEWEVGKSRLSLPGPVTYTVPYQRVVEPTAIPTKRDHRMNASLGFKFRTGATTFVANALIPVLRGGIQPNVVWTTGVEFNF